MVLSEHRAEAQGPCSWDTFGRDCAAQLSRHFCLQPYPHPRKSAKQYLSTVSSIHCRTSESVHIVNSHLALGCFQRSILYACGHCHRQRRYLVSLLYHFATKAPSDFDETRDLLILKHPLGSYGACQHVHPESSMNLSAKA